jgi:hypothetical protein
VNLSCAWVGDADHNAANVISLLGQSVTLAEHGWLSCLLTA